MVDVGLWDPVFEPEKENEVIKLNRGDAVVVACWVGRYFAQVQGATCALH